MITPTDHVNFSLASGSASIDLSCFLLPSLPLQVNLCNRSEPNSDQFRKKDCPGVSVSTFNRISLAGNNLIDFW